MLFDVRLSAHEKYKKEKKRNHRSDLDDENNIKNIKKKKKTNNTFLTLISLLYRVRKDMCRFLSPPRTTAATRRCGPPRKLNEFDPRTNTRSQHGRVVAVSERHARKNTHTYVKIRKNYGRRKVKSKKKERTELPNHEKNDLFYVVLFDYIHHSHSTTDIHISQRWLWFDRKRFEIQYTEINISFSEL